MTLHLRMCRSVYVCTRSAPTTVPRSNSSVAVYSGAGVALPHPLRSSIQSISPLHRLFHSCLRRTKEDQMAFKNSARLSTCFSRHTSKDFPNLCLGFFFSILRRDITTKRRSLSKHAPLNTQVSNTDSLYLCLTSI